MATKQVLVAPGNLTNLNQQLFNFDTSKYIKNLETTISTSVSNEINIALENLDVESASIKEMLYDLARRIDALEQIQ